jgi:hypothetical protein
VAIRMGLPYQDVDVIELAVCCHRLLGPRIIHRIARLRKQPLRRGSLRSCSHSSIHPVLRLACQVVVAAVVCDERRLEASAWCGN